MKFIAQVLIILLILIAVLVLFGCRKKKKWLSSQSKLRQVIGSFYCHPVCIFLALLFIAAAVLSYFADRMAWYSPTEWFYSHTKLLAFLSLTLLFILLIRSFSTLSTIFTLRKEEIWITRTQIAILTCSIILIGILFIFFGTQIKSFIEASLIGTVLSWIFQDSIKGAVTFVKFRSKGMLNIGDWIKLDKSGVDGKIKSITLTTIYIENWDSTTSAIPMSILYSEQLQNLQKMNEGKTNGRRMMKEFIIDSSWIHSLGNEDVLKLKSILGEDNPFFQEQVKVGKQNIQVYREYLNYYLHCHPRVSHEPRLTVRWMRHIQEGVVIQIYAFLLDTALMEFEKTQSSIFEHIIESMDWFGLQLYQTPSSYDSKSSTIYLSNKNETE